MYLKTFIYVIIFLFPFFVLVRDLKDKNFREQSREYQSGTYIMLSLYIVFAAFSAYFYNDDLKASHEMTARLAELSSDNEKLRKQITSLSIENAGAYKNLSDSQCILREKAETQTNMQRQLTEKSEENALLNSQMANLQRDLREKAEDQIESQHQLRDKVEENALLNSQMANLQREQNQSIHEIRSAITDMNNALIAQGILKAEMPEKGKGGQFQAQGMALKMTMGTAKIFLSSTNIIVLNGQTEHIFDGDLSISVKINSSGSKGRPFLHAMLVSPGKNIGKIDTDKSGYCIQYGKYTVKVKSISSQSADLTISLNEACDK